MTQAIGIRLPREVLEQIDELSKSEMEDRSTTIRKLVMRGYKDTMIMKAAEDYKKGNITISEAAKNAGLTIWEMEKHLVEQGFKSSYSIEDLDEETRLFEN